MFLAEKPYSPAISKPRILLGFGVCGTPLRDPIQGLPPPRYARKEDGTERYRSFAFHITPAPRSDPSSVAGSALIYASFFFVVPSSDAIRLPFQDPIGNHR